MTSAPPIHMTEETIGKLRGRWSALWRRTGANGDAGVTIRVLVTHCAESHRAYHTLAHVEACLREFDAVRNLAAAPDAVEWAIWFHDAVYEIGASDNEERSAALARQVARDAGLPNAFGASSTRLILATKHATAPASPDAALVVDIDLAVLGQPPGVFDEYERQIRQEYRTLSDAAFAAGRAAVLRGFLARPRVYSTDLFHSRHEAAARRNLERSLAAMECGRS